MPLYEYQCDACGHRFETIQRFSDSPLRECPACEGMLRKLISSPAIQFKGSGWYITDYARKGNGSAAGANGSATGPSGSGESPADGASKSEGQRQSQTEGKSEGKAESKPAATGSSS
jgi:putative FmdB family regulatory protein